MPAQQKLLRQKIIKNVCFAKNQTQVLSEKKLDFVFTNMPLIRTVSRAQIHAKTALNIAQINDPKLSIEHLIIQANPAICRSKL